MNLPKEGDLIRVVEETLEGGEIEHVCTVQDVLASQLRATYEWRRPGNDGWNERSLWVMYRDLEWDTRKREWKGRAA